MFYYPCITDHHGKILKKVSKQAMTKEQAEDYLKRNYWKQWINCEAIPQLCNTPGLHD